MLSEFPADISATHRNHHDPSLLIDSTSRRPATPLAALMEAAPGDEPVESLEELQRIREIVAEAMEHLSPEHRYCIDAINSERVTYEELADRLGISDTHSHRLTKQATAALRQLLIQHPLIRGRIFMHRSWNEAAREAVMALAPTGDNLSDDTAVAIIDRKMEQLRAIVHSGQYASDAVVPKLRTIGTCAAMILDNQGAWSVDEMADLLVRKQNDYGHGNINAFGLVGLVVRTSDKVARYHNLATKEAATEPRIDALVDMVGYATIASMLEDGTFQLEMEVAA